MTARGASIRALDRVRAVLLDLDGTLIDSTALIVASHEHTLRAHFDGRCPDRRAIIRGMGRPLADVLREHAQDLGCPDAVAITGLLLDTYRRYQRAEEARLLRTFPGMRDVLVALEARGFLLGVVTSKIEAIARPALERFHLDALVPVAVFHGDTDRHKPDPAPLLEATRRGGVEPSEAVYVGDSTHDLLAGRAAGMRTVAALWGPNDRADLEAVGPDRLAETPEDLLPLLGEACSTV